MKLAAMLAVLAFESSSALAAGLASAQAARVWSVNAEKQSAEVTLIYAEPSEGDHIGISLRCTRGVGQISVAFLAERRLAVRKSGTAWVDKAGVPAPWPTSVVISSGAASTTLRGQAEPDQFGEVSLVSAEVASRAPVVAEFRKSGLLKVQALGSTVEATKAAGGLVRKFLGACK